MLRQSSTAPVEEIPEIPFYISATGSSTRPRRSLKHGDCFAVLDSHADIGRSAGGPDGIFFRDTRHLSHLELLNGGHPLLLGSSVRDDNSILTVDLTNPDIYLGQKLVLAQGRAPCGAHAFPLPRNRVPLRDSVALPPVLHGR